MDSCGAVLLATVNPHFSSDFIPLLPWKQGTLFESQLNVLERSSVSRVVSVLGQRADELLALSMLRSKVRRVIDPRYIRGLPHSLYVGLRALHLREVPVFVLPVSFPVDERYVDAFLQAGFRALEDKQCSLAIPRGDDSRFPFLLSPDFAAQLRARRPPASTLGELLAGSVMSSAEVCSVEIREGVGGPPISCKQSYRRALGAELAIQTKRGGGFA